MACRLAGDKPLSESMLEHCCWIFRNKLRCNFNWNSNIFIQENAFEIVVCEMTAILSWPQWVILLFRNDIQYKYMYSWYRVDFNPDCTDTYMVHLSTHKKQSTAVINELRNYSFMHKVAQLFFIWISIDYPSEKKYENFIPKMISDFPNLLFYDSISLHQYAIGSGDYA